MGRAWSDLLSGKASNYNGHLYEQYELIKNMKQQGQRNIILPPLFEDHKSYPLTIFYNYQELTTNPKATTNRIYARYWGVDSIRVTNTASMELLEKTRTN